MPALVSPLWPSPVSPGWVTSPRLADPVLPPTDGITITSTGLRVSGDQAHRPSSWRNSKSYDGRRSRGLNQNSYLWKTPPSQAPLKNTWQPGSLRSADNDFPGSGRGRRRWTLVRTR